MHVVFYTLPQTALKSPLHLDFKLIARRCKLIYYPVKLAQPKHFAVVHAMLDFQQLELQQILFLRKPTFDLGADNLSYCVEKRTKHLGF